jgi:N-succinyldiaminopimelate aminotransferase
LKVEYATLGRLPLNPRLRSLQPYPFERLRALLAGAAPAPSFSRIDLSIGEPKHDTPRVVTNALADAVTGLSRYPPTAGSDALRGAIAGWLRRRHGLAALDAASQVLPVLGSREALFALAQTVVDPNAAERPVVVSPNPFYQIYEGAALLAGAEPHYVAQRPAEDFRCDWHSVAESVWRRTALLFVCSPGNPSGAVLSLTDWRCLFELSDRWGFVIAADECYSEIYFDEARPPLGALAAAQALGRTDYRRLAVLGSLSKRSNCPGMRSGYVAGDAALIKPFLLYRTYHGSAMSPVFAAASIAAWEDEDHVIENRRLYREKFDAVTGRLAGVMDTRRPEAGFYLWAGVPGGDDESFVRDLYRQYNVVSLPGSYLAREQDGINPGRGFVRLALVEPLGACLEGARRIQTLLSASPSRT